jgi:hypothetical protein
VHVAIGLLVAWLIAPPSAPNALAAPLPVELPCVFRPGYLEGLAREAGSGDPSRASFTARCSNGGDISWGPCPGGICAVSVTYPGLAIERARLPTRYWIRPIPGSPWADTAPDVHWTRFLRDVAGKDRKPADAERDALRLTRALAVELRDTLANACRARRCAAPAHAVAGNLAAYLRDRSPSRTDVSAGRVDHWSYDWTWTATGGGVALRLSCTDMQESPETMCDIRVDLPGDLYVVYATFDRAISLRAAADKPSVNPLGRIVESETLSRKPAITVEGQLLRTAR